MQSKRSLLVVILTVICSSNAASQAPPSADENAGRSGALEEIIVTAQRKEQSLQEVAVAVSAYDEQSLEAIGIQSIDDLRVASPNIQGYDFPTSANNVSLFIRGLGNLDSQTLTTDNPVGIYVDDVYIARSTGALIEFLDLERIEVLRGPQGTLYGRNSSAGAIKFISRKPSEDLGLSIKGSVGNFNLYKLALSADIPITNRLRSKISLVGLGLDGWVKNEGANDVGTQPAEDFNARTQLGARLSVSWDISDVFVADYSYNYTNVDSTPPYFQAPAQSTSRTNRTQQFGNSFQYVLPKSAMSQQGHSLTLSLALSDSITLKSVTSYQELDDHVIQNWSDTLFFATDIEYGTEAFSQEFQVQGTSTKIDYVAGLYYFSEDGHKLENQFLNYDGGPDFTPGTADDHGPFATDALLNPQASLPFVPAHFGGPVGTALGSTEFVTELTSTAVFGQISYAVNDSLRLTAGVRYTEDKRKAVRSGTNLAFAGGSNNQSFDNTDYTFILEYSINDRVNTYAKVVTGYRSGGSSERAPNFAQTFQPEDVTNYEVGLKSQWLENQLRLNAAIFRIQTNNAINTIGGTGPQAALQETFNFGEVNIHGLEVEVLVALGSRTTLGFNYAYLDSSLSNVIVPAESVLRTPGADIASMAFVPQTPKNAFSITFDQGFTLANTNLVVHLDYSYRDKLNSSAISTPVGSLGLLNGRLFASNISLGNAMLDVGLWIRNLTDEKRIIYDLAQAGNQFNTPRTFGLDAKLSF